MTFLIVEDEKSAVRRLTGLLEELCPGCRISGSLDTIKSAVNWIRNNPAPDLAFFDIQLADGLSFEIFITAYDEYALRAFEVNSIDYLLKPVEKEKLQRALNKYERFSGGQAPAAYDTRILQEAMEVLRKKSFKERFIVKYGDHLKSVPSKDIACFMSEGKATFFTTADKKKYLVDFTMDQVSEMLDPGNFFRINRKFIIHIDSIKDMIAWSNSRLKLVLYVMDHPDLVVAREKVQDFRRWLDR